MHRVGKYDERARRSVTKRIYFWTTLGLLLGFGHVQVVGARQSTASPFNHLVNLAANLSSSISAESRAPGNDQTDTAPTQSRNPRYRLCASDAITLTFPITPEFDQTINIQPDGYASLTGVGDIHLEGLTSQQASDAIRAAYANILHDPIISLELKDFNKPYFTVSGQVNKPGKYDLRGNTSATEAIAMAGGFNDSAKHSQVLLFRRVNDDWFEVKSLNLKRILQGHAINEDPEINPGDMVFVPQNFISKIKKFIPSTGVGTYYELYQ